MHLSRLSGRKRCDYVIRRGEQWKGKHVTAVWLMPKRHRANELRKLGLYIGVQASTKLHKSAVKRNRMRRRCREALRIAAMDFQGLDGELILRPRSSSLECAFEELLHDARSLLTFLSAL